MFDLNQMEISAQLGDGVLAPQATRTFKLSKALGEEIGAGTICKLKAEESTGLPVIEPIASEKDVPYCVIASDLRRNKFGKNDKVKGWVSDEVVWLKAKAKIQIGEPVMGSADGTVAKQTNTNVVLGIAESYASGNGVLVAVRLTAPYKVANEVLA